MTCDLERRLDLIERKLRWRTRLLAGAIALAAFGAARGEQNLVVDSLRVVGETATITIVDGVVTLEHRDGTEASTTSIAATGLAVRQTTAEGTRSTGVSASSFSWRQGDDRGSFDRSGLELVTNKRRSSFRPDSVHLEAAEGAVRTIDLGKRGVVLSGRLNETVQLGRDRLTMERPDGGSTTIWLDGR